MDAAAAKRSLRAFTEDALREWLERDGRRKDLEREARQLAAENKLVADDLLAAMKEAGKNQLRRGPILATIDTSHGSVSWKDAFVRVAGAEAATELQAQAPTRESISIRES